MKFVNYDPATGQILFSGEVPDEMYGLQPGTTLPEEGSSFTHYVDIEKGILVRKPDCPGEDYLWNYATKQWELNLFKLKMEANLKRKKLFLESDWTQLLDVPLPTKEKWAVYRQALRDITDQEGYPININWPTIPE